MTICGWVRLASAWSLLMWYGLGGWGGVHAAGALPAPTRCTHFGYLIAAPAGWKVNLKGCTDRNTSLFSLSGKAYITLLVTAAGSAKTYDVAALIALFTKQGYTVIRPGYITVHEVRFTVCTLDLSDPTTHMHFTVYYAITIHKGRAYAFLGNVFITKNPSYATMWRAAQRALTTFRFITG